MSARARTSSNTFRVVNGVSLPTSRAFLAANVHLGSLDFESLRFKSVSPTAAFLALLRKVGLEIAGSNPTPYF